MLSEYSKKIKEKSLLQANYNAQFIMNEKANDNYKEIQKEIYGKQKTVENINTKYKRYKMICKRIGLKTPIGW